MHRSLLALALLLGAPHIPALHAQGDLSLAERIQRIIGRAEFRHATFGIKFQWLDRDSTLYSLNADKLFVPGSTTKLVTAGTALELLRPDFRFHTRVYRAGPVSRDGVLRGDLVLVASGDPNLSARIRGDSLRFVDEDHSYGSDPSADVVPGDPLLVLRELARAVKGRGIGVVQGRVLVDARLFRGGDRELGTGVVISPVSLNDNLVDVTVTPGATDGKPAVVKASPETGYLHLVNRAVTGPAGSGSDLSWSADSARADGSRSATLAGSVPAGGAAVLVGYRVPDPKRFAEVCFTEALRAAGVRVASPAGDRSSGARAQRAAPATTYPDQDLVAEHVSPPFREAVKVILKVSQNLHASMTPFVVGAVLAGKDTAQAGYDLMREFLQKAGLDLSGATQGDGAGGAAHFTPDFMVGYLAFMAKQSTFGDFSRALPILGRDGTLAKIQKDSPAAGHVLAKTGTFVEADALNRGLVVNGKGLAGYLTTRDGRRLAFAIYANNVKVPNDAAIQGVVGQALGEIAAAAYDASR